MMIGCEAAAAADAQNVIVVEIGFFDDASDLEPLRPLDLDRRHGQKQRPGKIGLAADARLSERFLGRDFGQPLGEGGRGGRGRR